MKVQKILLLFVICLSLTTIVLATDIEKIELEQPVAEWADFSKATLQLVKEEGKYGGYELKIDKVDFQEENIYYIFIANSMTKPTFGKTEEELEEQATTSLFGTDEKVVKADIMGEFIERKGDIYVWIVELNQEESVIKEVLSARKVEKPQIGKIGTRIGVDFNVRYTYVYLMEPYNQNEERKVNLKIGKVTEEKVLQSIKNKEQNALENLMEYAKKDTPIYTQKALVGSNKTELKKANLQEHGFYYVYKEKEGTQEYDEIEDISLYQAVYETIHTYKKPIEGMTLVDFHSDRFNWDAKENTKPAEDTNPKEEDKTPTPSLTNPQENNIVENVIDNTMATKPIPQAGQTIVNIVLMIIILLIGVIFFIKYTNYKDVK